MIVCGSSFPNKTSDGIARVFVDTVKYGCFNSVALKYGVVIDVDCGSFPREYSFHQQ